MKKPVPEDSGSARIDEKSKQPGDWRGKALAQIRALIKQADPDVVEEVKWRKPSNPAGIPVWYHDGIICTGETHSRHLRLTFAKGASIKDSQGVFNAGFEGKVWRAVVIREGDKVDAAAFKDLIRAAVALNLESQNKGKPKPRSGKTGRGGSHD
ncbi:MAG TPA: DUF1801 domain-containing protein [Terriglobia bacterium]|nr:DUF1801 domain-containing protein [Terriglobia bacterium]